MVRRERSHRQFNLLSTTLIKETSEFRVMDKLLARMTLIQHLKKHSRKR